jgi:MYXO-CTERM domain-containing protein
VCCDRACDGTCEACTTALKESGADGTCGAARDGSSPLHGMCPADPVATCGRDGKCSGSGGCRAYYPGTTPCGPGASCTNGIATTVTACDGNGACTAGGTTKCNAYVCGAEACKTSCASDADCAMGSTCDVASARCVSTATCDHDHTTISTTGEPHDCSPYKCNPSGACEAACKSVEDCVAPTQCDPTGHCVTPAADDTASGCNASPKRTTGGGLWLAAVGLGLFVVRRRRSGKAW